MKGNPRCLDDTGVQSNSTSFHRCQDVIISRLQNWRTLEWNLLRESQAIPSFSRPKTTTLVLAEPQRDDDRDCELCRAIEDNYEPAERPQRPRGVLVELDYTKSVRLFYISILSPTTKVIAKRFHVYALESAFSNFELLWATTDFREQEIWQGNPPGERHPTLSPHQMGPSLWRCNGWNCTIARIGHVIRQNPYRRLQDYSASNRQRSLAYSNHDSKRFRVRQNM